MEICLKVLYFFGALLSFADPFTDGLTCWKYFEAGQILWFSLCIVFMLLPGVVYFIFWIFILPRDPNQGWCVSKFRYCFAAMCCPFLPCCGKLYVGLTTKKHEDHELYMEIFNCLEVGIELAPQFILQFYAAMIQEKSVSTIQMVSLTITFLRIGWCYAHINNDCKCRTCLAGLLSVAARVFAFGLFAVALGAWVVLVIAVHLIITCVIQRSHKVRAFGYIVLSWLSYAPLGKDKVKETDEERVKWTSRTFIQPLLHVVEDILMAVLYYFFVDDASRTYAHRLKITLGLVAGTILGYIILRLSKFGKCQQSETTEFSEEEVLNDEPVTVVVVDGKKREISDKNIECGSSQEPMKKTMLGNIKAKLPKRGDNLSGKVEPEGGKPVGPGTTSAEKTEKENKVTAAIKSRLPQRKRQTEDGKTGEKIGETSSPNNINNQSSAKTWLKSKFGKL